jgi:hypothetical protein
MAVFLVMGVPVLFMHTVNAVDTLFVKRAYNGTTTVCVNNTAGTVPPCKAYTTSNVTGISAAFNWHANHTTLAQAEEDGTRMNAGAESTPCPVYSQTYCDAFNQGASEAD